MSVQVPRGRGGVTVAGTPKVYCWTLCFLLGFSQHSGMRALLCPVLLVGKQDSQMVNSLPRAAQCTCWPLGSSFFAAPLFRFLKGREQRPSSCDGASGAGLKGGTGCCGREGTSTPWVSGDGVHF